MNFLNVEDTRIKANEFSIKCFWIGVIISFVTWFLDILGIFIIDLKLMTTNLIGASIFLILAYVVKFTLGFDKKISCYLMLFLNVSLFTFAGTILSYHVTMFLLFPIVCAVLYQEKEYFNFTFILTVIGIVASIVFGFKYGLCDSNMLLFTIGPTSGVVESLVSNSFDINQDILLIILFFAVPRILCLLGFAVLLNHIKESVRESTAKEVESRHKAEIDGLTGLYNRYKFNEYIEQMENKKDSNVGAIYIDANGLKDVNDRLGHEQGDELIVSISNILARYENDYIKPFRIGGDEFVVIMDKPQDGEIETIIQLINNDLSNYKASDNFKLSAAIGYALGEAKDIKSVVNTADKNMYLNKLKSKKN